MAVGERGNWPSMSREVESRWATSWNLDPVGSMLSAGAFQEGFGKLKDLGLGDLGLDLAVNLLPPIRYSGRFNKAQARVAAKALLDHAVRDRWWLVMLGRRVTDTICKVAGASPSGFGYAFDYAVLMNSRERRYVRLLSLPHPSGRSPYLNSDRAQTLVKKAIKDLKERSGR